MAKTAVVDGCKCSILFGGAEGDRTPDLRIANAALCQTELLPHSKAHKHAGSAGILPAGFEKLLATRTRIQFRVLGFKSRDLSADYADYTDSNHTLNGCPVATARGTDTDSTTDYAVYAGRGTATKRHKRRKQNTLTNYPQITLITQIQITHQRDGVGLGDAAGSGLAARVAVNVPEPRPMTCTVPLI